MYTYIDNTKFNNETKEAIKGILGAVLSDGDDINLDFDDVKTIISDGDMVYVGIGEYEGKNSAEKAIKLAIKNSTLDFNLLAKATGILIHFEMHANFPMMEICEATEVIHENAHEEANIIWGTTTNKLVGENYLKVIVAISL